LGGYTKVTEIGASKYKPEEARENILDKVISGRMTKSDLQTLAKQNPRIREKEIDINNNMFASMKSTADKLSEGALIAGILRSYRG
jgi:hypothetical protein